MEDKKHHDVTYEGIAIDIVNGLSLNDVLKKYDVVGEYSQKSAKYHRKDKIKSMFNVESILSEFFREKEAGKIPGNMSMFKYTFKRVNRSTESVITIYSELKRAGWSPNLYVE
jgi:hypothetical protein